MDPIKRAMKAYEKECEALKYNNQTRKQRRKRRKKQ